MELIEHDLYKEGDEDIPNVVLSEYYELTIINDVKKKCNER